MSTALYGFAAFTGIAAVMTVFGARSQQPAPVRVRVRQPRRIVRR